MKIALLSVMVGVTMAATPALADFWVVRESPTAECKVVETKPADTKMIVSGNKVYKTREEATKELTTICKK
jgi:hypothetical protein